MAATTQFSLTNTALTFLKDLGTGVRMVTSYIADLTTGVSATREAMRLHHLSDAELDELGITRDQIVPYAFGDQHKFR